MTLDVPHELLSRYDQPGPRYTSYPTAPVWNPEFGPGDHRDSLIRANEQDGVGMSLYVHVPFCRSMCFYCGCSVIISRDPKNGDRYVDEVLQEAALARATLQAARPVVQHHWGGGTPTFLSTEQLERLFKGLAAIYPHAPDAEVSIEVDPRVTSVEQLEVLRGCGFNRISMGVQDFDEQVQVAINRVQSYELTRDLVDASRSLGFTSVNLDLVYGLPHQTVAKFGESIEQVLQLRPDRLGRGLQQARRCSRHACKPTPVADFAALGAHRRWRKRRDRLVSAAVSALIDRHLQFHWRRQRPASCGRCF